MIICDIPQHIENIYYYKIQQTAQISLAIMQELMEIENICSQKQEISSWMAKSMIGKLASILKQHIQPHSLQTKQKPITEAAINEQINQTKQIIYKKVTELDYKVEKLNKITNTKMTQLYEQARLINDQNKKQMELRFQVQIKKRDQQLTQTILQVQQNLKTNIAELRKKVNILSTQLTQTKKKMKGLQILAKENSNNQSIMRVRDFESIAKKQINTAIQWVDSECFYYKNLNMVGKTITVKQWGYIFGRRLMTESSSFSVKIQRMKGSIGLGVADQSIKTLDDLTGQKNWIRYWSYGNCWAGKERKRQQDGGFKQGETITIKVNLDQGIIEWSAEGTVRQRLQCPQLRDSSILWVPFIGINDNEDKVIIVSG